MKKLFNSFYISILIFIISGITGCNNIQDKAEKNINVGAYFYDGWGGKNALADDPDEPWAKNAPRGVRKRMIEEFTDREPLWGWRADSQEILERQIDLASEAGIDFFLFCWYWRDPKGSINPVAIENAPAHTSMKMFMKAANKHKMKFGLLVANHQGAEISGPDNWARATDYWMKYFNDPQYVKVEGKPLVVIFSSNGISNDDIASMQETARQNGFKEGISIAGCGKTEGKDFTHRTHYNIVPGYSGGSEEHKYSELVQAQKDQWAGKPDQPYIPLIIVGWDKRPWESKADSGATGGAKPGWYYPDHTPSQLKTFIGDAVKWMDENPDKTTRERMILLYAWNELGEGGYLVPTKGDPEANFLKAVSDAIKESSKK